MEKYNKLYYSKTFYDKSLSCIPIGDYATLCKKSRWKDNLKRAYFSSVFIDESGEANSDNVSEETTEFMAVDIDHVSNPLEAQIVLFNLPFCVHSQVSFSGNGVWGIVRHNIKSLALLPIVLDKIEQMIPYELDKCSLNRCSGRSMNLDYTALSRSIDVKPLIIRDTDISLARRAKINTDFESSLNKAKPYVQVISENCVNNPADMYMKKVLNTIRYSNDGNRWNSCWKSLSTANKKLGCLSKYAYDIERELDNIGLTHREIDRLIKMFC